MSRCLGCDSSILLNSVWCEACQQAVDRAVRAQAWGEGFQAGYDSAMGISHTENPYKGEQK